MSPCKPGPEGYIPADMYKALCAACGSFMRINQINAVGGDNCRSKLIPVIAEATNLSIYICTELLRRLSLDGSSINRGGRPAAYYHDPRLPQVGISTSKTSQTITMITGSNAWGEALPPHFQFMTSAQTDEGERIRNECVRYMRRIIGTFGLGGEKSLPVSLGMNEKGGMDEEEFAKYIRNAILPLYPNAAPETGKWVILKCDSGPGRLNLDLLADLRMSGFILFPER